MDAYQLKIYNMSNVLVHDSTKISLSPNLYQNDTLIHDLTANTLTNGNQYFFTFTVFQGATSVTSKQTSFYAYSMPNVVMTVPAEITSKKYTFLATYSQTESISSNYWSMTFLDSNDEIILTTTKSYSGLIQYEFDGFISGNQYKVYTTVTNQQNVTVQSPIYGFIVTYASPSIITVPSVELLPELSATKIEWSPAYQITGIVTGTSSYSSGIFTPENIVLNLDNDSYVEFDVDVPEQFTLTIDYIPSQSFTGGKMIRLENIDLTYFEIGYNSTLGCYYYDNNNFILNGSTKELLHTPFLIAIKGVEVLIISNNEIYDYIYPH